MNYQEELADKSKITKIMYKIISWNVLYRAHEEKHNPGSIILRTFPEEKDRVAQIVEFLIKYIDKHTIACLQEVSADVIAALTYTIPSTHKIFSYNIRKNDEHLVTIAPKEFEMKEKISHPSSNGYLTITNGKYRVVNCHLRPQRFVEQSVLGYLRILHQPHTFIAGDFNECYKIVNNTLQDLYVCPYYGKTYKKKTLDHIIFSKTNIQTYDVSKMEQYNISDHDMICLGMYEDI